MSYIASGKFKHSPLQVPHKEVRSTQGFVRLAIFNFLSDFIENASVLDLFGGAGTFGIEALSRGARKVVFVDIADKAFRAIQENIRTVGIKDATAVYKMDALTFLVKSIKKHRKFDIIFIDPPFDELYQMKNDRRDDYILEILDRAKDLLNPQSIIIVKYPKKYSIQIPSTLALAEERRFGINKLWYLVQKDYIKEE